MTSMRRRVAAEETSGDMDASFAKLDEEQKTVDSEQKYVLAPESLSYYY